MRLAIVFVLGVAGLSCRAPGARNPMQGEMVRPASSDSRAVTFDLQDVLNEQVDAWNRGDIEGFMDYYWRSEDMEFISGDMIHRGWQGSIGNVDDHAETINILRRLDDQLATTIATRRGIPKSKVVKLMRGEDGSDGTWFDAAEALSAKLVDEVLELGSAKKRQPGNRADREREARHRRLRLMELDADKWESENAARRGGPDRAARQRRLAELAGHAKEFATS